MKNPATAQTMYVAWKSGPKNRLCQMWSSSWLAMKLASTVEVPRPAFEMTLPCVNAKSPLSAKPPS
jgi:hypothetical protein